LPSGTRNWYVDGVLSGQDTGLGAYNLSTNTHLAIGGKDQPAGNNFTGFFTGEIYGVRFYNTAISAAQVNSFITPVPVTPPTPAFNGKPVLTGNQLVLTWSNGTLLSSTNVAGPYLPVAGATSPYTNLINLTTPDMFFKLSNP
jgi:hypothetical protein